MNVWDTCCLLQVVQFPVSEIGAPYGARSTFYWGFLQEVRVGSDLLFSELDVNSRISHRTFLISFWKYPYLLSFLFPN